MKFCLYILLLISTAINSLGLQAQTNKTIKQTLQNYKQCLQNSDKKLIGHIVDNSFRIGIYQQPIAGTMFATFLSMMQAPDSVYWSKISKDDKGKYCMVHYTFGNQMVSSQVRFSDSGRLLFSDWLDEKGFGMYRRKPSTYVTSVPFKLFNGKIFIKARLNNSETQLNMLFDTGADGMALRTDLQDKCNVKISRDHTANVPGGQVQTKISEGNSLVLDSLTIPHQNLVLFDKMGKNVDGIIGGVSLFKNYIVEVDFEKELIRLYSHGAFNVPDEYRPCEMTYANGVPTIPFYIYKDGRRFDSNFIFDTGAGYEAILFGSGMKQLAKDSIGKHIPALYHSYNYSVGHKSEIIVGQTDSVKLANMAFKKLNLAMEPYRKENHGRHNVLGSIGIKTLKRFNWIVDLTDYKIYSKPNRDSSLPMAFALNGYLFEYLGKHLRIMRNLNKQEDKTDDLLKPGDYILKFDNIPVLQLTSSTLEILRKKAKVKLTVQRKRERFDLTLDKGSIKE